MPLLLFATVACAFFVAVCLVPLVRACCRRLGIVDNPDRDRKLHSDAVSLGGGIAVFFSIVIASALVLSGDRFLGQRQLGLSSQVVPADSTSLQGHSRFTPRVSVAADELAPAKRLLTAGERAKIKQQWLTLFLAAGVLVLIGLVDDIRPLSGKHKLLLQFVVVAMVVGTDTVVQRIGIFGSTVDLGIFAYPITVLWLLGAINALNLLDGADGVASTAGAVIAGGLTILCIQTGNPLGAAVAAAVTGSLLGFLVFNRPPATIYLGDAGSMVVGLFIGVISIWGSVKESTLASYAPLMVLTLPMFDSVIAILRRVLTGRGIYAGDRGHIHHQLLDRFSHPRMLVVLGGLCGISTASAVLSVWLSMPSLAIIGSLFVIGLLVFTRSFGHAELRMLASRTSRFGDSLLGARRGTASQPSHRSVHLQGYRGWDKIWESMVEFADDRGLAEIRLDIGIAWIHEGYHGSWRRPMMPEKSQQMWIKLPLSVDGRNVGRLEAVGDSHATDANAAFQLLIERSEELQEQISCLIHGEPSVTVDWTEPESTAELAIGK